MRETDAELEHALPNRRLKKRKKMPGELCDDTAISDADSKYEVQVHNVILDTIIESRLFPDVLLKTENYTQISPCLIPRISMT